MELSFGNPRCAPVLVTLLCGAPVTLNFVAGSPPILRVGVGLLLTAPIASAAKIITAAGERYISLLGADALQQLEVSEWLEFVSFCSASVLIKKLDEVLQVRTYLAGASFSLADIAAFAVVADLNRVDQPLNVRRWLGLCESRLPLEVADALASSASPLTAVAKGGKKEAAASAVASGKATKGGKGNPEAGAKPESTAGAGAKASLNIGGGGKDGAMPVLKEAVMGGVVTRFPPEPSGYLHIGHAKALLLNDYYARTYQGKLILRFDDTNPSKEKEEFELNIAADIAALGIKADFTSHTSDYFDVIEGHARRMISEGKAFMDNTPREAMQAERMALKESAHRGATPETNMRHFETMLLGGEAGSPWCLRMKMDMTSPNGTIRDPVIYRVNETPHHKTGTRYKAYPTYDFACPIVDSLEGVTHALRSSEYHDRDAQFYLMIEMLGIRKVHIQDFARLNFNYTLLSKRKLAWFVDNNKVDGWYDPRFPTVQGMLRRGLVVPALREFILNQGASIRPVTMEWDKFWAVNKKHIDPVAPRYTCIVDAARVLLRLSNGPAAVETRPQPFHMKNPDLGTKAVFYSSSIWLELDDVEAMAEGEEVTLMKWGNCFIRKIHKDAAGRVTGADGELHLAGDFKKTEKKVTWLADTPDLITVELVEYDYLITVPKLDEGDDFTKALNPTTELRIVALAEAQARTMQVGDIVQVERKGFYRCDRTYLGPGRPAVLFFIPDGKVKGLFNLAEKSATWAARVAAIRA